MGPKWGQKMGPTWFTRARPKKVAFPRAQCATTHGALRSRRQRTGEDRRGRGEEHSGRERAFVARRKVEERAIEAVPRLA